MKQSLQEINRLAAQAASEAVEKLFKERVVIEIPKARVEKIRQLRPIIAPGEMTVGIYLPVGGDAKGAALLVIPNEAAFILSDILLKKKPGTTRKLSRMDKAALKEVGNIICGQYFTVFANKLGIKIIENIPSFSYSMFGSIISDIIARFSRISDDAVVAELKIMFPPKVLKAYFMLLFEPIKITQLIK